jgi:phosphohistidine phosphatase
VTPTLWLLRHGDAVPHEADEDFRRALTEKGEAQARAAGTAFAALGLTFDAVLTSPKVRARDTARLACEAAGLDGPEEDEALAEGFTAREAVARMEGRGDDARVLLVGHEPDLSGVVESLTGGRVKVRKGGAAALALKPGVTELRTLFTPDQLSAIAGRRR